MKIKQKGGDSKKVKINETTAPPHLSDILLAAKMGREIKLLIVAMAITTITVFATGLPGLNLAMNDVLACEGNLCNDNVGVPLDDSGQTTATCGDGTGTICVPPEYICEKAVHLPACNPEV